MGIGKSVTLVDFRVEPDFGALPQPDAGIERGVDGLAPLPAGGQTVGAFVRRSDRRIGLPDERGLAVHVDAILRRRKPGGSNVARLLIGAGAIVRGQAQFLQRQVGLESSGPHWHSPTVLLP